MTVRDIATVVAAIAALLTVLYARQTVRESRTGRREASDDHRELMAEQGAANDIAQANAVAEMSDRAQALYTEITLQRMTQFERIGDLLVRVVELAKEEAQEYGTRLPVLTGEYRILPALLTRLGAAVTILESLKGPQLLPAARLAAEGPGENPVHVLSLAVVSLQEMATLARNIPELRLDP